ncbi:MAG: uroporphyrinogen decarboxylase family protein [Clostridia bacterium]
MTPFVPDYHHIVDCAYNRVPKRLPLYEHIVSANKIGEILHSDFASLQNGGPRELDEFFRVYCGFFHDYGYDIVPYEECISGFMPGSGCLGNSSLPPPIRDRADFERYPWAEIPERYFQGVDARLRALRKNMPDGMKAVGGAGNGIFECVQDITGYQNLCYLSADDPELYADLFQKVADTNAAIWQRFLKEYGDIYCVLRFGDDLGFRSATLLPPCDIHAHILPGYKRIVAQVHAYHKPFLLHSCGAIFAVMDALINDVGIDAKHSNEDQIAPFPVWVERYGTRIGNFGGIDTDAVCRLDSPSLKAYIVHVLDQCVGHGGFAFGSGNSIPDYVPAENYLEMIRVVREYRGDFL